MLLLVQRTQTLGEMMTRHIPVVKVPLCSSAIMTVVATVVTVLALLRPGEVLLQGSDLP